MLVMKLERNMTANGTAAVESIVMRPRCCLKDRDGAMTADLGDWHGQSENMEAFSLSQSKAVDNHGLPIVLAPGPFSRSGLRAGGG